MSQYSAQRPVSLVRAIGRRRTNARARTHFPTRAALPQGQHRAVFIRKSANLPRSSGLVNRRRSLLMERTSRNEHASVCGSEKDASVFNAQCSLGDAKTSRMPQKPFKDSNFASCGDDENGDIVGKGDGEDYVELSKEDKVVSDVDYDDVNAEDIREYEDVDDADNVGEDNGGCENIGGGVGEENDGHLDFDIADDGAARLKAGSVSSRDDGGMSKSERTGSS
jgi:hypothetical protein